jgi:hypothetical protein
MIILIIYYKLEDMAVKDALLAILALINTGLPDSAKLATIAGIAEAALHVYEGETKPVPEVSSTAATSTAAGGGGNITPEPKTISFKELVSRATTAPAEAPAKAHRPDQPPAPKPKDDTPDAWSEHVKDILRKTLNGKTPSNEDVKTIWDFLWNVFPHKIFPTEDSIYESLSYGVKCDYYHKDSDSYLAFHMFLQKYHFIGSVRHFFKVVYDEDGNYLL